jgi:hypothetical protein
VATVVGDPVQATDRAWVVPARLGALAVAGTAALAVGNPDATHVPLCPLKAATGLDCPLCGGLRAVHALTRFRLGEALDHNALFTLSVPFLIVGWVVWMHDAATRGRDGRIGPRRSAPTWAFPALVAVLVAFGVARNLPGLAWLGSSA